MRHEADRRMRWTVVRTVLALAVILIAACGGNRGTRVETRPDPESTATSSAADEQTPSSTPEVQALAERAERHYEAGRKAYRAGHYQVAREHFDRALAVYLDADVEPQSDAALRRAFNEMVARIHAMELDDLFVDVETPTPPLLDDTIPPLTEAETELLRSRLEERRSRAESAEPRYTVPMPEPLENPKVLAALEYLSTDRKEVVEEGVARAGRYVPMIQRVFEEQGLPPELAWLPLIESLFKPHAVSRARAVGMWQFMSGTARLYDLDIDWFIDERRDPVKATHAAARFLKDYYEEFGDWHLTLAAYNAGKGRLGRALRRSGAEDFWELAETRYIPRETRDFVPKVLAAILIGNDPEAYGLSTEPMKEFDYDEVTIDSMTDLRVIADCADTTLEVLRNLNPQLLKATTPNRSSYTLRIPAGTKSRFEEAFAEIPPDERVFFVQHRVDRGETLSTIAASYKTSLRAIQDLNTLRNPHRIWPGQQLIIPVGQPGRPYRGSRTSATADNYREGEKIEYTVQRGDTLALIASTFRTSVPDLMRWNGLSSDMIYPGNDLVVYYDTHGPAPDQEVAPPAPPDDSDGPRRLYTVQRGDSLYTIAARFGVALRDLARWNRIDRRETIYPGDKLVVYGVAPAGRGNWRSYTVVPGDTLSEIADRFDIGLSELLRANALSSRSVIRPGDELKVPGSSGAIVENLGGDGPVEYTVRRGDTLIEIARRYGVSVDQLCAWNSIDRNTTLYPGRSLTIDAR